MTESRGILFNGVSVRAILDGRQTQARRVITLQPPGRPSLINGTWEYSKFGTHLYADFRYWEKLCPYGVPGDLLYVKEKLFRVNDPDPMLNFTCCYAADDPMTNGWSPIKTEGDTRSWKWKRDYLSARFMPKWAARLWLRITDVRVDKVQNINEIDAIAEGAMAGDGCVPNVPLTRRAAFRILWDSINARRGYGWEPNPWVWCISFERICR